MAATHCFACDSYPMLRQPVTLNFTQVIAATRADIDLHLQCADHVTCLSDCPASSPKCGRWWAPMQTELVAGVRCDFAQPSLTRS